MGDEKGDAGASSESGRFRPPPPEEAPKEAAAPPAPAAAAGAPAGAGVVPRSAAASLTTPGCGGAKAAAAGGAPALPSRARPTPELRVATPLPGVSLLQYALQDSEPEVEYFACSELLRSLPCVLPTRREHAGRNCFNKRPKGTLLRPASASGGAGPGGREWDWEPKVGEYIDTYGPEEEEALLTFTVGAGEPGQQPGDSAYRWTRVPVWASLWHKPWAKVKLMLGNEDGGSSELEATRSSLGCVLSVM